MPRIPTAEDFGLGNVRSEPARIPRQSFQTSKAQFGGAAGRALERAGGAVRDIGTAISKRDAARGMDAYATAARRVRDGLYNSETGLLRRTGRDAAGVTESVAAMLAAVGEAGLAGLDSDAAATVFRPLFESRMAAVLDTAARHESEQERVALQSATLAVQVRAMEEAAENRGDPQFAAAALARGLAAAELLARGEPAGAASVRKQAFATDFHKTLIAAQLTDDPAAARAYYDRVKSQVAIADRNEIEGALSIAEDRAAAKSRATDIWAQSGGDLAAALDATRQAPAPTRADVMSRLKRFDADRIAREAEIDRANDRRAWDIIDRSGDHDGIPPALWRGLRPETRLAIIESTELGPSGHPSESDPIVLDRLLRAPPDMLIAIELRNHRSRLGAADYRQLERMRETYGQAPESSAALRLATLGDAMTNALERQGIDADTNGNPESAMVANAAFRQAMREFDILQDSNGNKSTPAQIREIADRVVDALATGAAAKPE